MRSHTNILHNLHLRLLEKWSPYHLRNMNSFQRWFTAIIPTLACTHKT